MLNRSALVAATVLTLIAGCGAPTVTTSADKPDGSNPTAAGPGSPANAAKVGSAITLEGSGDGESVKVTLVKIVDPAKSSNSYLKPDKGNRYVAIQWRITNTGSEPYSDSPSNGSKIIDTQGQQFDAEIVAEVTAGPDLGSPKVAAGKTVLGYVVYQVPKASKVAGAQFALASGFGAVGEWSAR